MSQPMTNGAVGDPSRSISSSHSSNAVRAFATSLILVAILLSSCPAVASGNGAQIGDYWEYSMAASIPGADANFSGTYRQEVTALIEKSVAGGTVNLMEIGEEMDGLVSIQVGDSNLTGTMRMTGAGVYYASNFSQVSYSYVINMSESLGGATASFEMGLDGEIAQPFAPFFDGELYVGKIADYESSVTVSGWMDFMGSNITVQSNTTAVDIRAEVIAADVTVVVPAGSFKCYQVELTADGNATYYYYSEKVGNFVKVEQSTGGSAPGLPMGDVQLVSYSRGPGAAAEASSIQVAATIGGVVAIVTAVVMAVILSIFMRPKKPIKSAEKPKESQAAGRSPTTPKGAPKPSSQPGQQQRLVVQRTVKKDPSKPRPPSSN